jgi:YegS/Rv2252/BmrU family lipid kinase
MTELADREAARAQPLVQKELGQTLVIWNPSAGSGSPGDHQHTDRRASIQAALEAAGVEAELYESGSEADSERKVDAAIAGGVSTIVAAGGDGTVRSIAFKLLNRDVTLGILPLGSAMNVARSLDIPLELEGAAAVLAEGQARAIDVGEVWGRPFLEVAWIGLGAEVLAGATEAKEGRLRRALAILRRAFDPSRTRVRLQVDGREVRGRATSIAIANGRFTGRGIELASEASLDDGRFDILVYEGSGRIQLLVDVARVLIDRVRNPPLRRFRGAVVRVSTHRPLPVRADSNDIGVTPVQLEIRPKGLRVIAPPPARGAGR